MRSRTRWSIWFVWLVVMGTSILMIVHGDGWPLVGGGLVGLCSVSSVYLLAPALLRADLTGHSSVGLTDSDRLQAVHSLRSFLLQGVASIAIFLGLFFTAQTLRATNESLDLNRLSQDLTYRSQTAEQFMRAIDQLGQTGPEKIEVRAGGIYSLGLIAEQSRVDGSPDALELRRTIFKVLQSFLFQHDSLVYSKTYGQNRGTPGGALVDADFQAAVTVLTKHPREVGDDRLDLSTLDLPAIDLRGAHLEGSRLDHANLEWADLRGAHLESASLQNTCLRSVQVDPAEYSKADTDGLSITHDSHQVCGRASG